MTIVMCDKCGPPRGRIHRYERSVQPLGHPSSAVICSKANCGNPGLVWLNEIDANTYVQGERDILI